MFGCNWSYRPLKVRREPHDCDYIAERLCAAQCQLQCAPFCASSKEKKLCVASAARESDTGGLLRWRLQGQCTDRGSGTHCRVQRTPFCASSERTSASPVSPGSLTRSRPATPARPPRRSTQSRGRRPPAAAPAGACRCWECPGTAQSAFTTSQGVDDTMSQKSVARSAAACSSVCRRLPLLGVACVVNSRPSVDVNSPSEPIHCHAVDSGLPQRPSVLALAQRQQLAEDIVFEYATTAHPHVVWLGMQHLALLHQPIRGCQQRLARAN